MFQDYIGDTEDEYYAARREVDEAERRLAQARARLSAASRAINEAFDFHRQQFANRAATAEQRGG